MNIEKKKAGKKLNLVSVDANAEAKVMGALLSLFAVYRAAPQPYATPFQLALILKVTRLYAEVTEAEIYTFLIKYGVPRKFENSVNSFNVPCLINCLAPKAIRNNRPKVCANLRASRRIKTTK
jgi:hypothetical protein